MLVEEIWKKPYKISDNGIYIEDVNGVVMYNILKPQITPYMIEDMVKKLNGENINFPMEFYIEEGLKIATRECGNILRIRGYGHLTGTVKLCEKNAAEMQDLLLRTSVRELNEYKFQLSDLFVGEICGIYHGIIPIKITEVSEKGFKYIELKTEKEKEGTKTLLKYLSPIYVINLKNVKTENNTLKIGNLDLTKFPGYNKNMNPKYLHQLQKIYKYLTGRNLNYKEVLVL